MMDGGFVGRARSARGSTEREDGRMDRRAEHLSHVEYTSLARVQSACVWETIGEVSIGAIERSQPMHLGLSKSHVVLQLLFSFLI